MALDDFLTCFCFMSFAIEQNQNPVFIQFLAV